jgi:hypothetical protein
MKKKNKKLWGSYFTNMETTKYSMNDEVLLQNTNLNVTTSKVTIYLSYALASSKLISPFNFF